MSGDLWGQSKKPVQNRKFTHGRTEQNEAIERITEDVHLTTGMTISRGKALHLPVELASLTATGVEERLKANYSLQAHLTV
ncbi:hypothetical protein [Raoultella sp. HC6]|uniref:hypothetical protein n=1 Tax=Raoultella sp. HC6 TaxID=2923366 RepID=UPI001F508659|nr:hypothetical protein [Raoultella sp. HC6]